MVQKETDCSSHSVAPYVFSASRNLCSIIWTMLSGCSNSQIQRSGVPAVPQVNSFRTQNHRRRAVMPNQTLILLAVVTIAVLAMCVPKAHAQNMTLEGQTGGFITPTAYTVPTEAGHLFSKPVVGFHFVAAGNVIGSVYTLSATEGLANRFEVGYTRSMHSNGDNPYYSPLWFFNGFHVIHGKATLITEEMGKHAWVPAVAVGGVYRWDDHYVSGAIAHTTYNNGDVYIVATRTLRKIKPPLLLNFGVKGTNASIFGIGGNSPDFVARMFGGLGIVFPLPHGLIAVPAAGFTQEPQRVKNLPGADIPTTLDYAVRVTQRENPRWTLDAGVGQVAGWILPGVNLNARAVFGMGFSYKF
jgi:hypothetical protein